MMTFLVLAVTALLATGCSSTAAAGTAPSQVPPARTIVALGDSLTSGQGLAADQAYPAVLERLLPAARRNLERIIEAAQERRIAVLLCGIEALPLYSLEYTAQFHRMFAELAETYGVPLVPFMLTGVIGNQEMLQPDFVHP